ncbi:hypothetical protein GCM10028813_39500 [Ramlibacter alkalitolerans]
MASTSWATVATGQRAFTEHGAIMAPSVLNSPRAIEVSMYVVRAFVRLRELVFCPVNSQAQRLHGMRHPWRCPMPNAYTRTTTIRLTEGERAELASMARSRSLPAALALRARIVLACEGEDKASTDVAQALGINRATVTKLAWPLCTRSAARTL